MPAPCRPAQRALEVADDAQFQRIVQQGQATALPELAHSVHVEVTGLQPGRWYHYRFMLGDAVSRTGRTRTAPAADALAPRLRVVYASCQRWENGYYAAWRHACADEPDLVLFLGDYIYENPSLPPRPPRAWRACTTCRCRRTWPTTARATPSQERSRPAGRPCLRALDGDLGRP
jgi:phosphodiesterase/alkaline phosphatase D-like protein